MSIETYEHNDVYKLVKEATYALQYLSRLRQSSSTIYVIDVSMFWSLYALQVKASVLTL